MNTEIRKDIFGYYDSPEDDKPTHDPGLETICPLCAKPLSMPVKTISLMAEGSLKSYFYRTHKDCYENASHEEILEVEGALVRSNRPTKNIHKTLKTNDPRYKEDRTAHTNFGCENHRE